MLNVSSSNTLANIKYQIKSAGKTITQEQAAELTAQAKELLTYDSPDYKQVHALLIKAATPKNAQALILLGDMYSQGLGVEQNDTAAFSIYETAAKIEIVDTDTHKQCAEILYAQNKCGEMLMQGRGVPQDLKEASYMFLRVTDKDDENPRANFNLGNYYYMQKSYVSREDACKYYAKALERGLVDGLTKEELTECGEVMMKNSQLFKDELNPNYAFDTARKLFVSVDTAKAKALLADLPNWENFAYDFIQALKGDTDSCIRVAKAYRTGCGVKMNPQRGFEICSNQAFSLFASDNFSPDLVQLLDYNKQCVEDGDGWGDYFVAFAYSEGWSVAKDENKVTEWLDKAIAKGIIDAKYSAANRYRLGEGVPQDIFKAFDYCKQTLNELSSKDEWTSSESYLEKETESMLKELLSSIKMEDEERKMT